jgi:hypothetical protein
LDPFIPIFSGFVNLLMIDLGRLRGIWIARVSVGKEDGIEGDEEVVGK